VAGKLTARQSRAIAALMTSPSVTAAAALAGVSRRALTNWLADAQFCSELRAAQDAAVSATARIMAAASTDAAALLADITRDANQTPAMRLAAARELLRLMPPVIEAHDHADRIADIESRLRNGNTRKAP
jgi:hypothetical protein